MSRNSSVVTSVDRITIDPAICHGKPIIRGMRWPVQNLLELLAGGMTTDEIISDHPELERGDIQAALEFAALQASGRYVFVERARDLSSMRNCLGCW